MFRKWFKTVKRVSITAVMQKSKRPRESSKLRV